MSILAAFRHTVVEMPYRKVGEAGGGAVGVGGGVDGAVDDAQGVGPDQGLARGEGDLGDVLPGLVVEAAEGGDGGPAAASSRVLRRP